MKKEPGWEREFYNIYGNYMGYRFQDFRSDCQHRLEGEMAGDCAHPENECSNSNGELAECLCDFCPCVEKDYDFEVGQRVVALVEMINGWNVYDWLDIAEYNHWRRRCPKCGETDVKYAIHSKSTAGCELSVRCNDCGHGESGNNSGNDAKRMVRDWHEQPNA